MKRRGMIKMKAFKKLKDRLKGLTDAIARFPLTTVFLLAQQSLMLMILAQKRPYLSIF